MKEPLISDEWTHSGSRKRKDTKRWCKGKVGREHVPTVELSRRFQNPCKGPDGSHAPIMKYVQYVVRNSSGQWTTAPTQAGDERRNDH